MKDAIIIELLSKMCESTCHIQLLLLLKLHKHINTRAVHEGNFDQITQA